MTALLTLAWPLALLVALFGPPRARAWADRLAPWAPLPLALPLVLGDAADLPWLLLGTRLAVDDTLRPLLLLTVVGWTLAGWAADAQVRERRRRFWAGWLGSLAGMLLLLLAGDLASFYLGYAVVSLSAYLLVTHAANPEARRAGRVYLVMAVAGEAAVLVGVLQLAGALGNAAFVDLLADPALLAAAPARWWLLAGFAVKLGILPLHVWLPLAHPVAPAPASAVLSGIIVKAGLAGWLRFVPPLVGDPRLVGETLLLLGLATAFGGVLLGLTQRRLKTVLAYSTISQMGLILAGFALAFLVPGGREALLPVLGLWALHHGLNKAALFVAYGAAPGASRLRLALFALPAVALAAAPLTTGFLAKEAWKAAASFASLAPAVGVALSLSSTGTALLLWKAFGLARVLDRRDVPLHPAWPLLVAAGVVVPWAYALALGLVAAPTLDKAWGAAWPLLLAAVAVVAYRAWGRGFAPSVPEGDLVVPIERALAWRPARVPRPEAPPADARAPWVGVVAALRTVEALQRRLPMVGLGLLVVGTLLWGLLRIAGTDAP